MNVSATTCLDLIIAQPKAILSMLQELVMLLLWTLLIGFGHFSSQFMEWNINNNNNNKKKQFKLWLCLCCGLSFFNPFFHSLPQSLSHDTPSLSVLFSFPLFLTSFLYLCLCSTQFGFSLVFSPLLFCFSSVPSRHYYNYSPLKMDSISASQYIYKGITGGREGDKGERCVWRGGLGRQGMCKRK